MINKFYTIIEQTLKEKASVNCPSEAVNSMIHNCRENIL
jgi:hypothetical protein